MLSLIKKPAQICLTALSAALLLAALAACGQAEDKPAADAKSKNAPNANAAADGSVVYSGNALRGYGNLVILKHNSTFVTAYAHNQTLLVKDGQSVKRGQRIAEMGQSESDRVKLHFEIRKTSTPVDPMRYLPPR